MGLPTANQTTQLRTADVIGQKGDEAHAGGNSIYAIVETLAEHFHSTQLVRPHLSAGVNPVVAAGAWAYGGLSGDIVAAGSIAVPYDVHGLAIDTISASDSYQLALVQTVGGVDTVVSEVSFVRTNPQLTSLHIQIQTPIIPANAQLRCKLASAGGGGAANCVVKVRLHPYA